MTQHLPFTQPLSSFPEIEVPTHLFEQLQALSEWTKDQRSTIVLKLSNDSDRKNCMALVRNFYEHIIQTFPLPQEQPWEGIQEKIKLTEALFKVLPLVAAAFCPERDFSSFAKQFFSRVFVVCHILDQWIDVHPTPSEAEYPSPEGLYNKAVEACAGLLRAWFTNVKTERTGLRGWQVAKEIAIELVALSQDLLNAGVVDEKIRVQLFSTPRLCQGTLDVSETTPPACISLENINFTPLLITSTLTIVLEATSPSLLSDWFITDLFRNTVDCASQAFSSIASPGCLASDAGRARSLTRLVGAMSTSLRLHPTYRSMAESTRLLLLMERLHNGPADCWDVSESPLRKAFEVPIFDAPSHADLEDILRILSTEQWGHKGEPLRILAATYLTRCIPHLDPDFLREMWDVSSQAEHMDAYTPLLEALQLQINPINDTDAMDISPTDSSAEKQQWRQSIREVVQALIQPYEISWMDDDDSLSDAQYISRALNEVESRFERPLSDTSASARLDLARELARLPCALTRHLDGPCPSTPSRTAVVSIPTGMRVAVPLLNGTDREVTPTVCRAVYDALVRVVRHHTSGFGVAMVDPVSELVMKGMKNSDRSVRLSAGRCFAELIKMYQNKGQQGVQYIDYLFNNLDVIINRYTDRFRETALITAGIIAKQANPETLYRALLCLISQLGNNNPVLKGTAFMQLSYIADAHDKSRYNLLHPYMDRFAIFIVDHMQMLPSLLTEYCSFLGTTRANFFTATLDAVIPHLFATCNGAVIKLIATDLSCDVAKLFWKRSTTIMADMHMITIPGTRQKILKFILDFFRRPNGEILTTEYGLVKSTLVGLVSELVINLGNEDDAVVRAAMQGLMKVADTLRNKTVRTQQPMETKPLGTFLESQILGVITHMTGILNGSKEKRSVEEKKCVCRALGRIVNEIGPSVNSIAPQIMALLQTMLGMPDLRDLTLQCWNTFLRVLNISDTAAYIGPTGAAFLAAWPTFSLQAREIAKDCLRYLVVENGTRLDAGLNDLADLSSIPELGEIAERLTSLRKSWTREEMLEVLLKRAANENVHVARRGLEELRAFLLKDDEFYPRNTTSGDFFNPSVGLLVSCLLRASCWEGEGSESIRLLAFECLGILGAADPYRFDIPSAQGRMIVVNNFTDEEETALFLLHLISDVLVGTYRSTSDILYQRHLAYALQELLKIGGYTDSLVTPGRGGSVAKKVRTRWSLLKKTTIETVTPLLKSAYVLHAKDLGPTNKPIYHAQKTYREWIQTWMSYLIPEASGLRAQSIFKVFPLVVKNRDVGVARHLLPHLVLNILISGTPEAVDDIRAEVLTVLEDQVDPASLSTADKKELSAQTVFMVLDHINGWIQIIQSSKAANKNNVIRVKSVLTSINQTLMARAAFRCKAYARALMSFEQQILETQKIPGQDATLQEHYERLHEIYAQLDEPDGMEGASTFILSPSLEHQIRQHESTGKWTSAQSCWEVNLQHDPDDLQSHLGLLRCLRSLGHYGKQIARFQRLRPAEDKSPDTLRTHVEGVLTRHPDWRSELVGYQVESECMVGDWDKVQALVDQTQSEYSPILLARILLAMREGNEEKMTAELSHARQVLGAPIAAVDSQGYRRYYEAVLNLHLVHELDLIYREAMVHPLNQANDYQLRLERLQHRLSTRLESTMPSFRVREPILSIRRTALELSLRKADVPQFRTAIGQAWLLSAKLARKAGYWHTAYSAVLQAQHSTPVFTVVESAKLAKASGEPLGALQELDNFYNVTKLSLANMPEDRKSRTAKAFILRARWMFQSDRYEGGALLGFYKEANDLKEWENGQFHWGNFQDKCFKALTEDDYFTQGIKMNLTTVKCYAKSIVLGSRYIYETVPRLLTIWMDMGERTFPIDYDGQKLSDVSAVILQSFRGSAKYKWYAAFRQMLSRIDHKNLEIWASLAQMIKGILAQYTKQALWLLAAVIHSKDPGRRARARTITGNPPSPIVKDSINAGEDFIKLCSGHPPIVKDQDGKTIKNASYTMSDNFTRLYTDMKSNLLIPIQESLVADLPPTSVDQAMHQPFPVNAPMIKGFADEITVMVSGAKPKKIAIIGDDGKLYKFLAKSKDDLRKDARLMDLDAILNKLLKADSEARRRRLHIRTYGVVPLNEESGLIEWVLNSVPLRSIVLDAYEDRGIAVYARNSPVYALLGKKDLSESEMIDVFKQILKILPPVFHEWFIKTFPEPSAWFSSRLAYTRTAAVMSMVGYIVGLGDRHCENILIDKITGDVVHIDFDCLFEKGQKLATPERVPFRLTQNVVDGCGVTGVEGIFRVTSEISMELLRRNKDCLRAVLDAFIHDPLTQWSEESGVLSEAAKNKMANEMAAHLARGGKKAKKTFVPTSPDWNEVASRALSRIDLKLNGVFLPWRDPRYKQHGQSSTKELPTNALVDMLLRESANQTHLAQMYSGWTPWM